MLTTVRADDALAVKCPATGERSGDRGLTRADWDLASIQEGADREERQQQFVARVRGSWEGG